MKNHGFGKKHPSREDKVRIVRAYESGKSVADLSEIFGFHPMSVYRWVREMHSGKTFERRKKPGSGTSGKIDKKTACRMFKMIRKSATKFGFETPLWNMRRIQIVCKKKLKLNISRVALWKHFRKMNYTCKKVQKSYHEANSKKQTEWIKENNSPYKKISEIP